NFSYSIAGPTGINISEKISPLRKVSISIWKQIYQTSYEIGSKWLVMELGTVRTKSKNSLQKKQRLEIVKESLDDIYNFSKSKDTMILIENLKKIDPVFQKYSIGDRASDLLCLMENYDSSHVGIIFDTGHAQIQQNEKSFL